MKKITSNTFALGLLVLIAVMFVFPINAQEKKGRNRPQPMMFSDFDTNKDHVISEKEFNTALAKRVTQRASEKRAMKNINSRATFADFDLNKDGKITIEEFDKVRKEKMKNRKNRKGNQRKRIKLQRSRKTPLHKQNN